jgi:LemA protein
MVKWIALGILGIFVLVGMGTCSFGVETYNSLVAEREMVKQKLSQVQNVYQRRNDLLPNLVEIVSGYAKHEHNTLTDVITARSKASAITIDPSKVTPKQLAAFQSSQGEISQALGRLMVVSEQYPNLKADTQFINLQSQVEGTENRIAVERREFNLAAQRFDTHIAIFPTMIIARAFAFVEYPYFQAEVGVEKAPKIKF